MQMFSTKYASSHFWTHNKTATRVYEYVICLEHLGFSGHGVQEPTNVMSPPPWRHTTSIIIFSYFIYCFFRWLNISTTMNCKSDICRYANTNKIFYYNIHTYLYREQPERQYYSSAFMSRIWAVSLQPYCEK